MTITKQLENGVLTVTISGWLNTTTAEEYSVAMSEPEPGVKTLMLDLDKLEYISSAGIREILGTAKYCEENNIDFRLVNVRKVVMEIFHITRLDRHLNIVPKDE